MNYSLLQRGNIIQSLATTHPELALQAVGWDPTTLSAGSAKKVMWACQKNPKHQWATTVRHRSKGTGCPVCVGQRVLVGDNDFATTHPELALQAVGWDPTTLTAGSHRKVEWVCQLYPVHKWSAKIQHRSNGSGCPFCSGLKVLIGENDLATTHPDLALQAVGWDPTTLSACSRKKVKWVCHLKPNHKWIAMVKDRSNGTGCPICSGRKILVGENDLATTHPKLALQVVDRDPTTLTAGSGKRVDWVCELNQNHVYRATITSRTKTNGTGCPYCAKQMVLVGENDLATTHPHLALQAEGWDPTTLSAGSNKKVMWLCTLNPKHQWSTMVINRSRGRGCSICSGRQVLAGDNDLNTTHPELALQALGWDPTTLIAGSKKKVSWVCQKNPEHIYQATISSRARPNGTGCPSCASYGFDPNKDGFLYFIRHLDLNMLQIGITNRPGRRLKKHKSKGWDVLEVRGPMEGGLARQWEKSILKMLTGKGADLSNSSIVGKFDGYTEAWSKSTFEANSIFELMQLTEEYEISVN
jgi:fructose-specific component phosphotransferase system IIB-like protein